MLEVQNDLITKVQIFGYNVHADTEFSRNPDGSNISQTLQIPRTHQCKEKLR